MKKYFRIMALLACTAALWRLRTGCGTEAPADHAYVRTRSMMCIGGL